MRNLKKVLAVVLTVALLAAMMTVPALAAVSYEDEALKLQTIGLFAGEPADLKLEEGVTRVQGLAFAIRAAGKEDEALALSDADVATELAKFTDAATVPAWAKKYTAYAIKNGITVGVGNNKLAPLENISGTSFLVFVLKSGMGYSSVTTANVVDKAVEAKVITAAQAVAFGGKAALIRDDAAAILYGAAKNGINADGKTFIQSLIDAGAVDPEDAADAGFIEDPSAGETEVKDVKAINLLQLEVELSNTNYDKDEVEQEANYTFDGEAQEGSDDFDIDSAVVEGTTLTITLSKAVKNQTEGTLEIDNDVFGEDLEFKDIDFTDNELPSIENAEVIGKDTVKVYFSEPMNIKDGDEDEFDFELDGKSFSPKSIEGGINHGYEANVKVYGTFTDGTLKVEIDNGLEDYAGFNAKSVDFELDVVKDEEPPEVVGFEDASQNEVTLVFDHDIEFVDSNPDEEDFYHTNEDNYVSAINKDEDLDGNKLTLKFADKKELPDGKAYVYVKGGAVKDLWGNKNDFIRYQVEIVEDNEKPTVEDIDVIDARTIKVTFSEALDEDSAEDKDNYVLTDDDDDEVTLKDAEYKKDSKGDYIVTLTLRSDADDGVHELTISGVKDKVGNKMDEYSEEIELDDEKGPTVDKVYAEELDTTNHDEWAIYVQYSEAMAVDGTYSAKDLYKYELKDVSANKTYNLGEVAEEDKYDFDASIKMIDNNETAKISIDGLKLVTTGTDDTVKDKLYIARVADASGDRSELSIGPLTIENVTNATAITFKEVTATDVDTIEVTFTSNVDSLEEDDFKVQVGDRTSTTGKVYAIGDIDIVDGDEIVITLDDDLPTGTETANIHLIADASKNGIETENSFGVPLSSTADALVEDEVAPEVVEKDDVDPDKVWDVTSGPAVGTDEDVQSVYAVYNSGSNTYDIYVVFSEALEEISKNLVTVTAGDDELTINDIIGEDTGVVVIKVNADADPNVDSDRDGTKDNDHDLLQGDSVDIKYVTDNFGNSVSDLKLNIEYKITNQ